MTSKIKLDIVHKDKARMEAFLNALREEFVPIYLDWKSWKESEKILDGVRIRNAHNSLTITILFADSHRDANSIALSNSLPSHDTARWGTNGDVVYLAESTDPNKVDEVLSLFAGKE